MDNDIVFLLHKLEEAVADHQKETVRNAANEIVRLRMLLGAAHPGESWRDLLQSHGVRFGTERTSLERIEEAEIKHGGE